MTDRAMKALRELVLCEDEVWNSGEINDRHTAAGLREWGKFVNVLVVGTGPRVVLLHPAGVTPANFAKLVGPMPGYECVFPRAANGSRWDHLQNADVPALLELGGDFVCGFSSGAFMASRMARERAYKGMAWCAGALLRPYAASWAFPCPTLTCHGTADQNTLYAGKAGLYGYLGAMDSAQALAKLQGVSVVPALKKISKTVSLYDWGGKALHYRVDGGGHVWPGSKAWQPPSLGKVDPFPLTLKMAEFFSTLT